MSRPALSGSTAALRLLRLSWSKSINKPLAAVWNRWPWCLRMALVACCSVPKSTKMMRLAPPTARSLQKPSSCA